jgi:hypothetical protein
MKPEVPKERVKVVAGCPCWVTLKFGVGCCGAKHMGKAFPYLLAGP